MVKFTLENGYCKYWIVSFVVLAATLSSKKTAKKNIKGVSQIEKAAMSCFQN